MTDFNAIEFLKGRSFPTTDVTLYVDDSDSLELGAILSKETLSKADEKRVKEIASKAEENALTMTLRGVPHDQIKAIFDNDSLSDQDTSVHLVAATLVAMRTSGGSEEREYSVADVEEIFAYLPIQSTQELVQAVNALVVSSLAFDQAADAGFFPKS